MIMCISFSGTIYSELKKTQFFPASGLSAYRSAHRRLVLRAFRGEMHGIHSQRPLHKGELRFGVA